jgi:SAM-dependent methyltransferase
MAEHGFGAKVSGFLAAARRTSREKGFGFAMEHVIWSGIRNFWAYKLNTTFGSRRNARFTYRGKEWPYFLHHYNNAWDNERTVEIPIAWEYVLEARKKDGRILELGNVFSHYYPVSHVIVDKYEKGDGVINEDIVDYRTDGRFDLIITVSTLEHIGWDEIPFDQRKLGEPEKIMTTVKCLKKLLAPGGKLVATVPVGHNPGLDKLLWAGKLRFDELYYMKRVSKDNRWEEVGWDDVKDARIGKPYPKANSLVVGVIGRPGQ